MVMNKSMRGCLVSLIAWMCCAPAVFAQALAGGNIGVQQGLVVRQALEAAQKGPPIRPGVHGTFSASATFIHSAEVDDGGEVGVSRWSAGGGVEQVTSNGTMFGFVFDHERSRYDFSGDTPDVTASIGDVTADRFGANLRRKMNEKWSMFGNADTTFNVADGVSWSDGQTYGGLVSFQRRVSDTFSFSLGLLARTRLEKRAMIFPIPGIDWKITKRLSLRTAQGATLSWQVDERRRWTADFTAGYESRSFRLDNGGVADDRRVPVTLSLRYAPNPGLSVRAFAGMVFAQRIEFLDSEGDTVETVDADPAAVAGLSGSVRF